MLDRAEQLLAVLLLEAAIGYPQALHKRVPHPVVWAGKLIAALDRRWNRKDQILLTSFRRKPESPPAWHQPASGDPGFRRGDAVRGYPGNRLNGIATVTLLLILSTGLGLALEHVLTGWTGATLLILLATTGLAQKSLHDHVLAVARPLAAGRLDEARSALAMIVGRDTKPLGEQGIAAAATESLAESFCDGVVAPAFWFLVAGLPGLFAFKAISTADSIIGHLDDRHRDFGWAAARTDDLLNLIPARLSGVLLCLTTAFRGSRDLCLASESPQPVRAEPVEAHQLLGKKGPSTSSGRPDAGIFQSWRIMLRDAGKHLSPNAGWPEAAMAGALGVTLGGGAAYDGEWIARAELGEGPRPQAPDLTRALALYRRACLLLWLIAGGLAWAL